MKGSLERGSAKPYALDGGVIPHADVSIPKKLVGRVSEPQSITPYNVDDTVVTGELPNANNSVAGADTLSAAYKYAASKMGHPTDPVVAMNNLLEILANKPGAVDELNALKKKP